MSAANKQITKMLGTAMKAQKVRSDLKHENSEYKTYISHLQKELAAEQKQLKAHQDIEAGRKATGVNEGLQKTLQHLHSKFS